MTSTTCWRCDRTSRHNHCIDPDCENVAYPGCDQCLDHIHEYEAEMAAEGSTAAPCIYGHYECAHIDDGPCHEEAALAAGYLEVCPRPYSLKPDWVCKWTYKPDWMEENE